MNKDTIFNFGSLKNLAFSRVNSSVFVIFGAVLLAVVLVISPASAANHSSQAAGAEVSGSYETGEIADPFEGLNRALFFINDGLDTMFLRPIAVAYTTFIPTPIRKGVDNFLANVATPVTLTNDILQGEWDRAAITTKRFVINSTVGLGGLVDYAETQGLPKHTEDFGQTLAVYGVGSGPYIFVPILGPSTPRHLVGRAVDLLSDPWTYILYHRSLLVQLAPKAVVGASYRGRNDVALNSIKETSADYYTSIKNLYSQSRRDAINNGEVDDSDLVDIPVFESR